MAVAKVISLATLLLQEHITNSKHYTQHERHIHHHHRLLLLDVLRTLLHGTAEASSGQEASAISSADKTEPMVSGVVINMPMLWQWVESNLPQTLKGNMHLHRVKTEDIRSHHRLLSL